MKKLAYLVIIIALFIGSCSKEKNTLLGDKVNQEMVEVNGTSYKLDYLREKLSIITGVEKDRLYFIAENMAFYDTKYNYEFKLSKYIESINAIE